MTLKMDVGVEEGAKEKTYVFEQEEFLERWRSVKSKMWQIVPGYCASVFPLTYGMMLGWPSPTYPWMTSPTSPIPISIDQSAMVAGFLMIGNFISGPFSAWSFLGPKFGMLIGLFLILTGWIAMYAANSIYWLLISRLIVGLGNGYGGGQMNKYIFQLCEGNIAGILSKIAAMQSCLGIFISCVIGNFVSFKQLSIVAAAITASIFVVCAFLPHTPVELLKWRKTEDAEAVLKMLNRSPGEDIELSGLNSKIKVKKETLSFTAVLRDAKLRRCFVILAFLVFFQQFSGAPSTIIYNQMMFMYSGCELPVQYSIVYSLGYLLSLGTGLFYVSTFNKKYTLLWSATLTSLFLAAQITVLYYDLNEKYWDSISLIVMLFYIFCHSVGLGCVPLAFAQEVFPKEAYKIIGQFYFMFASILALLITKIFQVLMDRFTLYVPFCLFISVSSLSIVFICVFIPRDTSELRKR